MDDQFALSTTGSKTCQEPAVIQPSEQDVACRSSTQNESLSSVQLKVLVCLLAGLVKETPCSTTLELSIYSARALARKQGISDVDFDRYASQYYDMAEHIRQNHPMVRCGVF